MGALISLFVMLISLMLSLTMSLFMTMINLPASLLGSGIRASAPRRSRRGSGGGATGGFVLLALMVLVVLAAAPRTVIALGLVIGAVVLAVLLLGRSLEGPKTPTAQHLAHRLENVRAMSGTQFELFVADLFRAMGHSARVLGGSGDQGVDVLLDYQGERVAVQCKNYAKAVGNKPVQEVYAGSMYHGCDSAWVVAPAGFTKGAEELARRVGVALYDAQGLRAWVRRIDKKEVATQRSRPDTPTQRRTVDLDAEGTGQWEETRMDSSMGKHTISVGTDTIGETVAFTAKDLGTAHVNGGKEAEEGMDWTYYPLPDHTYRVLIDNGSTSLLLPSNLAEALGRGEPAEYGRWTLEELQAEGEYGRVFEEIMKRHPEGRKRVVRDLD